MGCRLSLFKQFQGEQGSRHPGVLHWPGDLDGFPVLSRDGSLPPLLKNDELEDIERTATFHSRMFCLWDEQDHAEYVEIMTRAAMGWFIIKCQERIYEAEQKHFRVYLEWLQVYSEVPSHIAQRGRP